MNFYSLITPEGLKWTDPQAMSKYLSRRVGKTAKVSFQVEHSKRTLAENAYYHWVIVKILSDETGFSPEEMHDIIKTHFLTEKIRLPKDRRRKITRTRSTTDLTTVEFEILCENIRTWAQLTLNIHIPKPNE